ncbi:MAG: ABC transporter ATP-binding protein [Planctomycetes bacterium]|nr:ABC transporter ATP-binding protein [Planctomycetota bacterium]
MVNQLVARDVCFGYPFGPRVLHGVSLELVRGELVSLVGPNGSGKSTLLRCMAGLAELEAGEILLDDKPLRSGSARERALQVAVVPQFLPSLFDVRVEDFVLGGRYARIDRWVGPKAGDREAIESSLVACDALECRGRAMSELSGGQRQRVVVARAIAQEAAVLLVDEPTTSLDPDHQVTIFELLARLASEGRIVLVVTHELNLAAQFSTALAVLHEGRLVARGSVDALMRGEVLTPVYGERLHFGRTDDGCPFVVPRARLARRPQG